MREIERNTKKGQRDKTETVHQYAARHMAFLRVYVVARYFDLRKLKKKKILNTIKQSKAEVVLAFSSYMYI